MDKNKLGKTIEEYRCPKCHWLHTSLFVYHKKVKRCFHGCPTWMD